MVEVRVGAVAESWSWLLAGQFRTVKNDADTDPDPDPDPDPALAFMTLTL
jgi:hypothetical protein